VPDNRVKCKVCGFHYYTPGICAVCKPPKAKKPKKQSKGQKKKRS